MPSGTGIGLSGNFNVWRRSRRGHQAQGARGVARLTIGCRDRVGRRRGARAKGRARGDPIAEVGTCEIREQGSRGRAAAGHLGQPREKFRAEAQAIAQRLAAGPPLAYRYMKRNLNLALTLHERELLDLESEAMMRTGASEDFRNAAAAFLAKKTPTFEGR